MAYGADELPAYKTVPGISGNLVGVGSDTLNNMMDMWLQEFQKLYPNVTGSYKGEGSSTAPPALMEGTSQLGPMSRAMKDEELDAFEKKFGYKPTQIGRGPGLPGRIRQQGQPDPGLDDAAGRLHLLVDPQQRLRET